MSFVSRDARTYGSQIGSVLGGDPNWSDAKQTAIPNNVAALPRLGASVEFIRQAHAELSVLADLICGPVPPSATQAEQLSPQDGVAGAIEGAATELNIIAASVAECVMRIRSRLIG